MTRHGTLTAYQNGCKCDECRRNKMVHHKLWKMGRRPKLVDAIPTHRRIRALLALGWAYHEIGDAAGGYSKKWAYEVTQAKRVTSTTAESIDKAYRKLNMVIPDGPLRERSRKSAAKRGYAPPLAWDDIDDLNEKPQGVRDARLR